VDLERLSERVVAVVDLVPGMRRSLRDLARVEVIDRSLVIAAQCLFSVAPLLIVLAAFSPGAVSRAFSERLGDLVGLEVSDTAGLDSVATADQVRTQTGVGGIAIVLVSALSFARALQRMFERVWDLPHRGGVAGNRRCLLWLVSIVVYLQALALLSQLIGSSGPVGVLRFFLQLGLSVGAWWWSARMLVLTRVSWSELVLGAVLTGLGLVLLSHFSGLFMPAYVQANVEQFGGLGVLFAASTWLLAFGAVIVVATLLGRVYTEELGVMRRFTTRYPDRRRLATVEPGGTTT
jgi:membrane protein